MNYVYLIDLSELVNIESFIFLTIFKNIDFDFTEISQFKFKTNFNKINITK